MKKVNIKFAFDSNISSLASEVAKESQKMSSTMTKSMNEASKSIANTSVNARSNAKEISSLANSFDNATKKVSANKKEISKLDKAYIQLKNTNRDLQKTFGGIANAGSLAFAGITAGVTAFGTKALNTFSEYEKAITNTSGILGIEKGTEAYSLLEKTARDTAKITSKTATESAEALGYMARAGWSAKDSMESLASVIKFTEVSGSDLATTTDIITDGMDAFGLGASNLSNYLDTLTLADTKVNASSVQIAESMKEVGGVFKNLNTTTSESIALISSIASVAKGSEAGNALSTIFARFTSQTGEAKTGLDELGVSAYDNAGNLRNMIDVIEDMALSLSKLGDDEKARLTKLIGGMNYTAEFNMLMDWGKIDTSTGKSKLREMEETLQTSSVGELEKRWKKASDTVGYTIETLKSSFQELQINAIDGTKDKIKSFADTVQSTLVEVTPEVTKAFGGLIDKVTPFAEKLVEALPFVIELAPAIVTLTGALAGLKLVLSGINTLAKGLTFFKSAGKLLGGLVTSNPILAGTVATAAIVGGTGYSLYKMAGTKKGEVAEKYTPYESVKQARETKKEQKERGLTNSLKTLSSSLSSENIPKFATGTSFFKGGLATINEHGGEMVVLPSGSAVIPADKSEQIINNASQTKNININIDTFIGTREFLNQVISELDNRIKYELANI